MKFERLGDIVSISKGRKHEPAPKKEHVNFRYIQIEDLRNNLNLKYTDEKGVDVHENDLIIAWDGANAGTIGFGLRGMIGSTLARLRIKEEKEFNTDFLGFFLKKNSSYLRSKATGATIPHIDRNTLESLKIPVIDYHEQYEIAKVLSQSEKLISQRKESIQLLDKYLTSIFYEMFGDPIRNEMNWDLEFFEKLVAEDCPLTYGIVQPGEEFSNGVPVVRPVDLTETYVKRKGLKLIDPKISEQFKRTVLKGFEILMCVRGTTGIVSFASKELEGCNVTRGLVPIWFSESYNSLFAFFLLKSIGVQKEIHKYTYGATLQQINLGDLRKIKLIQPPLETQNKFAAIAQSVINLKKFYQESLKELENLYGSLSQQAFKGELEFKSTKEPFIGDPFENAEIPEGKLPSITDLDKTKWIDATEPIKEEVSIEDFKSTKKVIDETLFPFIGKVTGKGGDLNDFELLIHKHFKDGYFVFEDLKKVFVSMGFKYDYETLKNLVFELLRKGKIRQVFSDASFKTQFTDQHPDYKKVNELKEQMYLQRTTVL